MPVTGWTEYLLALAAFLASHALPARPPVRARLTALAGERGYLVLYVAASLALLGWLIGAAGRAPHVELWTFAAWQPWVPALAMPAAILLAAFGVAAPNPLSFAGRHGERFDPEAPGIAGVARHPVLWALALWGFAHAVPNGDLAHVVLFGGSGVFAILGMAMIDRRRRRQLGAETWLRLAARTSFWPLAALVAGRWRPRGSLHPVRLLAAVAVWGTLILLHPALFGVPPLPT
jgi:uncharacterized membrane protein